MPSKIFENSALKLADISTFINTIVRNRLYACSDYPYEPEKYNHHIVLNSINHASGNSYTNIAEFLKMAPLGLVQCFLLFAEDLNRKIERKYTAAEIVLGRPDLDYEETSILYRVLTSRHYVGFNSRTSSSFSLLENFASVQDYDKVEILIILRFRVTPIAIYSACSQLREIPINPSLINILCKAIDTVPYQDAINYALEYSEVNPRQTAIAISALLSTMKHYVPINCIIPDAVLAQINPIDIDKDAVLLGVNINGTRSFKGELSRYFIGNCICSPSDLFKSFRHGEISAHKYINILSGYLSSLSADDAHTESMFFFTGFLETQRLLSDDTKTLLLSTLEQYGPLYVRKNRAPARTRHEAPDSSLPSISEASRSNYAQEIDSFSPKRVATHRRRFSAHHNIELSRSPPPRSSTSVRRTRSKSLVEADSYLPEVNPLCGAGIASARATRADGNTRAAGTDGNNRATRASFMEPLFPDIGIASSAYDRHLSKVAQVQSTPTLTTIERQKNKYRRDERPIFLR